MMIIKSFWRGWEIWHEILRRSIASPPLSSLFRPQICDISSVKNSFPPE
jgi:hypothetical protein